MILTYGKLLRSLLEGRVGKLGFVTCRRVQFASCIDIKPDYNDRMKRTFTLCLVFALLLAGCVTSSKRLSEISLGMNKTEVIAVLGEPQSVSARAGGIELLRYQLSGRNAPPLNPNSKVFADGYSVQLIDGKVVAYGRDDEFRAITVKTELK